MIDLFLLAGEPSGDLQGAALIEELLTLNPLLRIAAVAGPRMRKFPIICVEPMESLQVMGFVDVALALPKIGKLFFSLRRKILELSPKAFVGIDYPGFNLRLHRSLKKHGFQGKLIHYICPTVWAWGKQRIPQMAETLDLLLTILPFEPACFAGTKLQTEYVGHPLTHAIRRFPKDETFRQRYSLSPTDKILSIFPGSRSHEIQRNLPLQLEAARALQALDPTLQIVLSRAQAEGALTIPAQDTYPLMQNTHMALAKSGTVTLELALHGVPTVIQYVIKPLDLFLARRIFMIHLPYYGLPNLILQQELFPELFGPNLTPEALLKHAKSLWFNEEKRSSCQAGCQRLWSVLGDSRASQIASIHIIKSLLSII
ncbi:MAG: lipid-A-disaccharide synthase [Verrucomicrobiota bacterium]|nr:lipid-A-disaccharide synthase [Verrucomicrobiota bacterium]